MIKGLELTDQRSCLWKANWDEMLFVLLARDPAAPVAIRAWIAERIRIGKNQAGDALMVEAEACAVAMQAQAPAIQKDGPKSWAEYLRRGRSA